MRLKQHRNFGYMLSYQEAYRNNMYAKDRVIAAYKHLVGKHDQQSHAGTTESLSSPVQGVIDGYRRQMSDVVVRFGGKSAEFDRLLAAKAAAENTAALLLDDGGVSLVGSYLNDLHSQERGASDDLTQLPNKRLKEKVLKIRSQIGAVESVFSAWEIGR